MTSSGDLLSCIEIRESLGNLLQQSFAEIWNSTTAKKWRHFTHKMVQSDLDQKSYNFCEHCPGMAQNECGDASKVVPFSEIVAQVKNEVARGL